jgi:hypothetical protein
MLRDDNSQGSLEKVDDYSDYNIGNKKISSDIITGENYLCHENAYSTGYMQYNRTVVIL